jgi:predicted dehydrogenase/threonine dehydrogenase-like Zn-dependent dehydrogenase
LKQIIQSFKTGETILEDVPAPLVRRGHVLIQTTRSLVSIGTEKMLVEFGKSSLISKARQQPERVKMVLDKIKADGLLPTLEAVFSKLEQPIPLGYCNVGKVLEVGEGVNGFKVGDRVASNGPHAEFVCVPVNLAVPIPENVSDDEACFTVIGSIGLQGIRLLQPTFGETIVVSGLGLIGLLTAEMLFANGCRVIGFDFDEDKVRIAREKGIEAIQLHAGSDPVRTVQDLTQGVGADGVLITASTKDSSLMSQAARMSRKRGRIILVGVTGLELNRAEFYEKELTFQVSCSYGPGRYDENYEAHGQDYPLPFVRWTEKRNFEAILQAISRGVLKVKPLISEKIDLDAFQSIYGDMKSKRTIASILVYSDQPVLSRKVEVVSSNVKQASGIGIIGAGNYTKMTMLPALKKAGANLKMIASNTGVSGTYLAKKYAIQQSTTDFKELIHAKDVGMVVITTRHNLHAPMTLAALEAGKDVFVEKPLAIQLNDIFSIEKALKTSGRSVMVGFNRRFSPFSVKMKAVLGSNPGPISVIATMNAGFIPGESWVHDLKQGGGRILGEACHFVDLISYFTGDEVETVFMTAMGQNPDQKTDVASIHLKYRNGSLGVINYFANGSKAYSKERVEVYAGGKNLIMDNFRTLNGYDTKGFSGLKSGQDKGHDNMFRILSDLNQKGGDAPVSWSSIRNTHLACFAALESLKSHAPVGVESLVPNAGVPVEV